MINDLLNVSLITTGRFELNREKTDLSKIIKDVVFRMQESITTGGSRIDLQTDGEVIGSWDKVRMEQVFVNLISNAIKYGNDQPIKVILKKNGEYVKLQVTDKGIGIPDEWHSKIFQRFTRGVSGKEYRGLGVGLYITNQIVRAHDGMITVNSKPSKGSDFTVKIPITKNKKASK